MKNIQNGVCSCEKRCSKKGSGEGENQILPVISELLDINIDTRYDSIDDIPYPAFHLSKNIKYFPVLTSRGCPLRCSFCASGIVSGNFRARNPESVVEEITYHRRKYNTIDFAFYDDALLYNKEKHIIPILERLLRNKIRY